MASSIEQSPLLQALLKQELQRPAPATAKPHSISLTFADPVNTAQERMEGVQRATAAVQAKVEKSDASVHETPLVKSILNLLNGGGGQTIERLAFETDPGQVNSYSSLYKAKLRLIPDSLLKRIAIQDDLVAAIIGARSNHVSSCGRPPVDRFSMGFVIEPKTGELDELAPKDKEALQSRIDDVTKRLITCGRSSGWNDQEKISFTQFLAMQTRNALTVGRCATEIVYARNAAGEKVFHSFRPIDAGTIYRAAPYREAAQQVRDQARQMLEQLKQKRIDKDKFEKPDADADYAWIQVVEGRPVQALTADECVVHSFYPVTDVELDGYPLTPLDTVIAAVTTHINIVSHNKLYFQSGRATRGMLVIKSDDVDETVIQRIRQQFNASINSVNNAWRMPVFGVSSDDEVAWSPIDQSGGRDMEFQYLSDQTCRVMLAAWAMSPEELPGYGHLSRGTNNQALCLCFSSRIWTDEGSLSLGSLLGNEDEARVRLWTGKAWADARVFRTGEKQKAITTLWNGSRLETSPDHRFRIIGPEGVPTWVHQKHLRVGDAVLVSRLPVPGTVEVPAYLGHPLNEDMMEVLGWLTGDGNISVRYNKNTGNIKQGILSWFYHHEREVDLWERHAQVLADFGLPVKHQNREVSEAEAQGLKSRYGFKSVAPNRLKNILYDTDFVRWLLALGFRSSSEGKVIPSFVHALPVGHRQAFLRGFFSADGTCCHGGSSAARIVIHNDELRAQTRELLLGLGIRTQFSEGKLKQDMDGQRRSMVPGASTLVVKDKTAFYERIGFLQAHKQPDAEALSESGKKWERIPGSVCRAVLDSPEYRVLDHNWRRTFRDGCSQSVFERAAAQLGLGLPSWVSNFYLEEVVALQDVDEVVEMADVEVFDDDHAFVANGVVVHNSESNNEYKLTAARDVGIRPLLAQFEDLINTCILPLFDDEVARRCKLRFRGLDADTAEKESTRLQQDMAIHMTMDEILQKVEKKPVGLKAAGQVLLNPAWQQLCDAHLTVGEFEEQFMGREGASKDPALSYRRDPMWFQFQAMMMQAQQAQQAQQQQAAAAQQPPQGGGDAPGGGGGGGGGGSPPAGGGSGAGSSDSPTQSQDQQPDGQPQQQETDLTRGIQQALELLTKSEAQLPPGKRRLLVQQRKTVEHVLHDFDRDSLDFIEKTLKTVAASTPAPTK